MRVLFANDNRKDDACRPALVAAIKEEAEVLMLAPNRNWSAGNHQRTFDRPLCVSDVHLPVCRPAGCVAVGLLGFLEQKPDLVVSGITKGANMGNDIIMSGTVAAAMAGVMANDSERTKSRGLRTKVSESLLSP